MKANNTYIHPILGGFPCSQAHDLLTCYQPDLKDKFSPIKKNTKKYNILTQISATAPLRETELALSEGDYRDKSLKRACFRLIDVINLCSTKKRRLESGMEGGGSCKPVVVIDLD